MIRISRTLVLAVLLGCAGPSPAPRPVRPSANVIPRAELEASTAPDLLEVVLMARPHWVPRGNRAAVDVYFEQSRQGGILELRGFHPRDVESIEYLSAGQAEFRLHDARGRPAIIIIPRRRR